MRREKTLAGFPFGLNGEYNNGDVFTIRWMVQGRLRLTLLTLRITDLELEALFSFALDGKDIL